MSSDPTVEKPETAQTEPKMTLRAERHGLGALLASLRGDNLSTELNQLSTISQSSESEDIEAAKNEEAIQENSDSCDKEAPTKGPAAPPPMNRREKRRLQRLQELESGEIKKKAPEVLEAAPIPTGLNLIHCDTTTFNSYKANFGYHSTRSNNFVHFSLQNNDGTRALAASQDRFIRAYDLDGVKVLWKHNTGNLVLDACWENSGKGVFSSSKLRPIQLFETETGEVIGAYNGKDSGDNIKEAMCIGQAGKTLIGGFKNQFQLWNVEKTGDCISTIRTFDRNYNSGFHGIPMSVNCHPTMTDLFAAAGTSPIISTYSMNWKNPVSTIEGSPKGYTSIRFSRDGMKLYASERGGNIHCFDTRMNMMTQVLKREMTTSHRTRFDIDKTGRLLYSGTSSGDIVVYDLHEFNEELQPVLIKNVAPSTCIPCVSIRNNKLALCTGQRLYPEDAILREDEEKREDIVINNSFQVFEVLSELKVD